jgi:ubiquitin C-terminal hydrolase
MFEQSQLQYWSPEAFICSYSKAATKVNVSQQQDVDEFFSGLFDKIEEELDCDSQKFLLQYVILFNFINIYLKLFFVCF